jgi:hypothetical protein
MYPSPLLTPSSRQLGLRFDWLADEDATTANDAGPLTR